MLERLLDSQEKNVSFLVNIKEIKADIWEQTMSNALLFKIIRNVNKLANVHHHYLCFIHKGEEIYYLIDDIYFKSIDDLISLIKILNKEGYPFSSIEAKNIINNPEDMRTPAELTHKKNII